MPNAPGDAAPRDSDILELLKTGGRDRAFEQLLDRYESKLFRLCCALLRDPAHAQDAAQESWLRIWKALPQYDGRASLSTWIYAITRNRCLTALARQPRTESLSEPQVESEVEALCIKFNEDGDQAGLLRGMVERLPERSRQVLLLSLIHI